MSIGSEYRYRDQARDGVNVAAWVVASVALIAGVVLAWVYLVSPRLISQSQQNFRNSYGTQQAYIDAARTAVTQAAVAADPGQKVALTTQACQLIGNVQQQNRPVDIASFAAQNCG